ncbi:rod shape-determining protein [Flavobacteriaceae bacterium]|nr:rod shape-determining protein [Flavobacteriaceae bacterium]
MSIFKSIPLYIRLYKNKTKISRLDTGETIERISPNPFSNKRIVFGNFLVAEEFLKSVIKELVPKKSFFTTLSVLLHQLELVEEGLTEIEKRAIKDSAIHIGASECILYEEQSELTHQEALNLTKSK